MRFYLLSFSSSEYTQVQPRNENEISPYNLKKNNSTYYVSNMDKGRSHFSFGWPLYIPDRILTIRKD